MPLSPLREWWRELAKILLPMVVLGGFPGLRVLWRSSGAGRKLAASIANILKDLAKARHPAAKVAAKAAGQAPAKQEVSKKRSCSSASFTQRGEGGLNFF